MSDENTDAKKAEEEREDIWLLRHLQALIALCGNRQSTAREQIYETVKDFFAGLNSENYYLNDEKARLYLERTGDSKRTLKQEKYQKMRRLASYLEKQGCMEILVELWKGWYVRRKQTKFSVTRVLDVFMLLLLSKMDKGTGVFERLYQRLKGTEWNFERIASLASPKGEYYEDATLLEAIGEFFVKLDAVDTEFHEKGRKFNGRAQVLKVKKELKKEIQEEVKARIDRAEESFVEKAIGVIEGKTRKFDEQVRNVEARFIRIVGIFATIIAFVVTMVSTSARLDGASIPVALAGLAIVTSGIILLLAMLFGKKDKPGKGLIAGISIVGLLFVGWFVYTMILANQKPTPLVPPSRVDTLYIDTTITDSSPPPLSPSTREGE